MMTKRTLKRSRSGADEPCPVCNKRLAGLKGLIGHVTQQHRQDTALKAELEARAKGVRR